ncbi:MAG: XRE family transcriptional regulator [Alphaproteobacteria bacterium]|nr:MAG: XRE family transcriptional regulator [Alphaproteobacteria bacterium]
MSFDPVDIHVGQRVKIRRKSLKLTQAELGEVLGLTFQQVQKYERGANRISASKLFLIAHTLDVPVAFFFEGLDGNLEANALKEESKAYDGQTTEGVLRFAGSMEGLELNSAFAAITHSETRKYLVSLFEAIAENHSRK